MRRGGGAFFRDSLRKPPAYPEHLPNPQREP